MADTGSLRDFLTQYFSDDEITSLCFDHFPEAYNNFAAGMSKGQKIQLLIDYGVRRETLPDVLAILRKQRPKQYARYLDAASSDQPRSLPPLGHEQSDHLLSEQANHPQPLSLSTQSGGVTVNTDKLDIGGDVTGRDKIVSAGGHIIHAAVGSTVIIHSAEPIAPPDRQAEHAADSASNSTGAA